MKSLVMPGIFVGCLLAVAGTVYQLTSHVSLLARTAVSTASCVIHGTAHHVEISQNVVLPKHTDARLCDTLTITNMDNTSRILAFGPHAHHIAYDGVSATLVSQGRSLSVVLNQPGSFTFHDHLDETVSGSFTVATK